MWGKNLKEVRQKAEENWLDGKYFQGLLKSNSEKRWVVESVWE
jgi:hypothetical protein